MRQARERTFHVEKKDAVPFRVEACETRLHGPAPLRVVGADVAGLRVFDWGKAEKDRDVYVILGAVCCEFVFPFAMVRAPNRTLVFTGSHFMSYRVFYCLGMRRCHWSC